MKSNNIFLPKYEKISNLITTLNIFVSKRNLINAFNVYLPISTHRYTLLLKIDLFISVIK